MQHIVICIFLLTNLTSLAQKEFNKWYFGGYAGIDFNTNPPQALTDGAINQEEGCASIADESGNLLFYSDGLTAWNSNHDTLLNGSGLLGDFSSTQSSVIVQDPGNTSSYYLFTMDEQSGSSGLSYSIVDMSLDQGNGGIVVKNVFIRNNLSEKLVAVYLPNQFNAWVITHGCGDNKFYAYLLTTSGLSVDPVESSIGSSHDCSDVLNAIGYMKSSHDGSKLALAVTYSDFVEVFDFNKETGQVTNPLRIDIYDPYGIEFSMDDLKLYVGCLSVDNPLGTNPTEIIQYDLSAGSMSAILASQSLIYSGSITVGSLQMGPDSNIYVAWYKSDYLGVIHDPDSTGGASNYLHDDIYLNGGQSYNGLPNFARGQSDINEENPPEELDEPLIFVPNLFSPNDDGINDKLLVSGEGIMMIELTVYSRWGEEVFTSDDVSVGWDGTFNGQTLDNGVFIYSLNAKFIDNSLLSMSGNISLLR